MPASCHFHIHSLPCQNTGHCHQNFELVWLTSVEPHNLYLLAPGSHGRCEQTTTHTGYLLAFSLEFLYANGIQHTITHWLGSHPTKAFILRNDPAMQHRIGHIIHDINREYKDNTHLSPDIIAGLLNLLLLYLKRRSADTQTPATTQTKMVRNFLASVKRQFITKRLVYDYALELSITPNYLNRVVKKLTGTTASDHIRQQIVLEAKRQIITSGASMKQVAYNLGFDNLAHFSKFFKNKSGQNYTAFKRSL